MGDYSGRSLIRESSRMSTNEIMPEEKQATGFAESICNPCHP